ncbi:hypothetical protein ACSXEJ_16970 (plasmid) [Clostridium perfringens]|uniref:Uncharacterized protein n=1 Tax=Clostridium perfringens E str. JGS1987 TaxID=451755 RepID=B1BUD6_CLOPF|nr:hypothetical protein [Clostridium perfringens]EDT14754.1 conserved hypothetical protein [Clostridium perfringens E str. JGS1987]EJT6557617.1 hypothetical protein [Clostridium perfringens]
MKISIGDKLVTTKNFIKHGKFGTVANIYLQDGEEMISVKICITNFVLPKKHLDYYFVKTNKKIIFMDLSTVKGFLEEEDVVNKLLELAIIPKITKPKLLLDNLNQDKDIEEKCICWMDAAINKGINIHLKILKDLEDVREYVMHIN